MTRCTPCTYRRISQQQQPPPHSPQPPPHSPQPPALVEMPDGTLVPDHLFLIQQGLTLTFGGEEVRVIDPGPSQASDKLAVYFGGQDLLFGSCIVVGTDALRNTADADLANWPSAVRKLEQLPAEIAVPGHGGRTDRGLLPHTPELRAAAPGT
jgi:glyoxylase-like metal-dependent hydrolase (beta-lactamase superfamily II)